MTAEMQQRIDSRRGEIDQKLEAASARTMVEFSAEVQSRPRGALRGSRDTSRPAPSAVADPPTSFEKLWAAGVATSEQIYNASTLQLRGVMDRLPENYWAAAFEAAMKAREEGLAEGRKEGIAQTRFEAELTPGELEALASIGVTPAEALHGGA